MRSPVVPNPRRVLVVDDQPHVRRIVSAKLQKAGYEVLVAEDGEEALAMAREQRPDVLVADYRMPGIDGMDLCRMLQDDPATANIPVVLLTAYDAQVLQQPLGNANIRVMVSKPFSASDILRVVSNLVCGDSTTARAV
jgi:two-component system, OmpR family, alkaline phosphatase synthesis response regulator PhoP